MFLFICIRKILRVRIGLKFWVDFCRYGVLEEVRVFVIRIFIVVCRFNSDDFRLSKLIIILFFKFLIIFVCGGVC